MQIFSSEEGEGIFSQHPLFSSLKIAIKKVKKKVAVKAILESTVCVFFFLFACVLIKLCHLSILSYNYLVISKDPNRQMEVTTEKGMADRVRN